MLHLLIINVCIYIAKKHGYSSKYNAKDLLSMGETKPLITKTGVVVSTFRQKSLVSLELCSLTVLNRKHGPLEPLRPPVSIKYNLSLNSKSIPALTRLLSH